MFKKLITLFSLGMITLHAQPEKIDITTVKKGIVCLTFDDSRYPEWLAHLPLFKKYNAHATFFYYRELDAAAIASMKKLLAAGHSVGLHTLHHRNATDIAKIGEAAYLSKEVQPQIDQMKAAGLQAKYFAYPNNRRDAETEKVFSKLFRHCRAGIQPTPATPGYWIADQEHAFIELDKIASTLTLGGIGLGDYYHSTEENLDAALEKAAKENKLIVFYSHGIATDAKRIHIRTALLEHLLSKAQQLGMKIASMDELP